MGVWRYRHILIGVMFDLLDFTFGWIPLLGDMLDVLAMIYWYMQVGLPGILAGVELIPLADILPINVALGLYATSVERE